MKRALAIIFLFLAAGLVASCAGKAKHHGTDMPDPAAFNAHFDDMDGNGDGQVKWNEFKRHFPEAEPKVFMATDLNNDSVIDHDEWHQFKEAHGLRDK